MAMGVPLLSLDGFSWKIALIKMDDMVVEHQEDETARQNWSFSLVPGNYNH